MVARQHRITRSRLTAALVTVSASALVVGTALVPSASAGATTAPVQVGLFGSQDPTYDGAFRQSLGLLAYVAAERTPPIDAVGWLLAQQCADGGFQAFRASTTTACQKSDPATFSGEDTNSTGIAAAALRAVGKTAAADRAVAWVLAAQNADGGFPYFVGGDSDANSTAVVLFGTNTAGRTPTSVQKGGVSAAQFLESLQIGCDGAATDDDGGFAFQSYGGPLVDSDAAAVQATLALSGSALPVVAGTVTTDLPRATCPSSASPTLTPAQLGAGHLARLLDTFAGAVPQFDYNTGTRIAGSVSAGDTAWAALSLAAVGVGKDQLAQALAVIGDEPLKAAAARTGARTTAAAATADQPGLLALAALATSAAGGSPASVTAYVVRIGATMRVSSTAVTPTPTPSSTGTGAATSAPASSGGDPLAQSGPTPMTPLLATLGGLLVLLGVGAVATTRRRGAHA